MTGPDRTEADSEQGSEQDGLFPAPGQVTGSARFDDARVYRYLLTRSWDESLPVFGWVMLNPSTADATRDDPTLRRVQRFTRAWGGGGVAVANLYAFRASEPAELNQVLDPIGPDNTAALAGVAALGTVVCAWSAHVPRARAATWGHGAHVEAVTALLRAGGARLLCLGTTASGAPRHPLYVARDTVPRAWPPAPREPVERAEQR